MQIIRNSATLYLSHMTTSPRTTIGVKTSRDLEFFRGLLRQGGYRATPARLSVLGLLKAHTEPLSISTITKKLHKLELDQATLYRIIKDFKVSGIVKEIDIRHGHAHYEFAVAKSHHHHIVCTECGKIADFSQCDFDQVSGVILKTVGTFSRITGHPSELFGVCKACDKRS